MKCSEVQDMKAYENENYYFHIWSLNMAME